MVHDCYNIGNLFGTILIAIVQHVPLRRGIRGILAVGLHISHAVERYDTIEQKPNGKEDICDVLPKSLLCDIKPMLLRSSFFPHRACNRDMVWYDL